VISRRAFIGSVAGGILAVPIAARGQMSPSPVIGFLRNTSPDASAYLLVALRQGLSESGFVEGKNVVIEYRWSEDQHRLPALAADLVRRRCAVIIVGGNAATLAAKAATRTIPIVFAIGDDPVKLGFVASLNRPGGNVTGVTFYNSLVPKHLELLHGMVPKAAVVGMLVNPNSPSAESDTRDAQAAARDLGQQIHILNASSERNFEAVFSTFAQQRAGAILIQGDALFLGHRDELVALVARHALPAMYNLREYVDAGGLMSYGSSITDAYRQIGIYAGRILKGAKPADLPVQQPTKFELVINIKTAKALGLTIPQSLRVQAELIEG
jgi:putative tryptophan/tyrosine transport system substrate-binding protein